LFTKKAVDTALSCDVLDADQLLESIRKLTEKHGVPGAVVYSAGYPVMGDRQTVIDHGSGRGRVSCAAPSSPAEDKPLKGFTVRVIDAGKLARAIENN
jgi:hypothetical protein